MLEHLMAASATLNGVLPANMQRADEEHGRRYLLSQAVAACPAVGSGRPHVPLVPMGQHSYEIKLDPADHHLNDLRRWSHTPQHASSGPLEPASFDTSFDPTADFPVVPLDDLANGWPTPLVQVLETLQRSVLYVIHCLGLALPRHTVAGVKLTMVHGAQARRKRVSPLSSRR